MPNGRQPDYAAYHRSLTDELYSIKDRIRDLVRHWPIDGESKEVALRSMLRRHLPESLIIGRGFIVTHDNSSTQIDILIVDANKPTLFKDGDLLIVTPDAVRAIIEVKTFLDCAADFAKALRKLSVIKKICQDVTGTDSVWTGLFVFEAEGPQIHTQVLDAVGRAYDASSQIINCVSVGRDVFVRHWISGMDVNSRENGSVWHSYELEGMAPSYFIGNLIDWVTSVDNDSASFAWFPMLGGKEACRRYYLPLGMQVPEPF